MGSGLQFHAGDFVEYDSRCSSATFRGVIVQIGDIGKEPLQPIPIAFVDDGTGRAPLMVRAFRLRHARGYATWLQGRQASAS